MGLLKSLAATLTHLKYRIVENIGHRIIYGLGLVAERMCVYALGTGEKDASLEGERTLM